MSQVEAGRTKTPRLTRETRRSGSHVTYQRVIFVLESSDAIVVLLTHADKTAYCTQSRLGMTGSMCVCERSHSMHVDNPVLSLTVCESKQAESKCLPQSEFKAYVNG